MAVHIDLTNHPLEVEKCLNLVTDNSAGGISIFVGTVRNMTKNKKVVRLEFEAYKPMAISEMEKIAQTVKAQWSAASVVIHHRVGVLEIGDIPVIIAVSTPHRKAAFEACHYAIDTLKKTVPIWKKEIFEDGEIWVAAHP